VKNISWKNIRAIVAIPLMAFAALMLQSKVSKSAWYDGLWIQQGQSNSFRVVSPSSFTPAALWSASFTRPDSMCRNNSSFTIWVGSTSGQQLGVEHSNVSLGFPVKTSETVTMGGSNSGGDTYAVSNPGSGTADIRCWDRVGS